MEAPLPVYCELTGYTDPGPHGAAFAGLPTTLPELCRIIKAQLIHPCFLEKYRDQLPPERGDEDEQFDTVAQMLEVLLARNPHGLVAERTPAERLIVSCRHHAILLASILRTRGTPVRVRAGFAEYVAFRPGPHITHWICEVWNADGRRWMLVDPDIQKVDFDRAEFEFGGETWLRGRRGEIDPNLYGVMEWWGTCMLKHLLCHDLACVLGDEVNYGTESPLSRMPMEELQPHHFELLDRAAELLSEEPNRTNLQRLREASPELQLP